MKANAGIKKIIQESRQMFRTPENLLHYNAKDFEEAERKFVKFILESGGLRANITGRPCNGDVLAQRAGRKG